MNRTYKGKKIFTLTFMILLILMITLEFSPVVASSMGTASAISNSSTTSPFDFKADIPVLSYDLKKIVYEKGVYVAIAQDDGVILTSKDLKNWKVYHDDGISNNFTTLLFNGDTFVVAGESDICYSKDGYNWTCISMADSSNGIYDYASYTEFADGLTYGKAFILYGAGALYYSIDGENWIKNENVYAYSDHHGYNYIAIIDVINDGKRLVGIGLTNSDNYDGSVLRYDIYTSQDGLHWQVSNINGIQEIQKHSYDVSLSFNNKKYYISTSGSKVYESLDLIEWKISQDQLKRPLYCIDNVMYSLGDGIYSVKENNLDYLEFKAPSREKVNSICKGEGKIVAVGTDGLIVCKDSKANQTNEWKIVNQLSIGNINAAASNDGCIVAAGTKGRIYRSIDGVNWEKIDSSTKEDINSVIYNGKVFIAVGKSGTIVESTDGLSWKPIDSGCKEDFNVAECIKDTVFIGGEDGTVLTSKDATNFSFTKSVEIDYNIDCGITGFTEKDGVFYMTSQTNIYKSVDGMEWKVIRSKGSDVNSSCLYLKNKFIAGVGYVSKDVAEGIDKYNDNTNNLTLKNHICLLDNSLLTGTTDGKILFSPDGNLWSNVYDLKKNLSINCFVKFKDKYYGFGEKGIILCGVKKAKTPDFSDITYNTFFDGIYNNYSNLYMQPMTSNNTMLLSIDTIGKIINCSYKYDKNKKSGSLSCKKITVSFSDNNDYAYINGKKTSIPAKAVLSNNILYVPAEFAFKALGYTCSFDDTMRRIYVKADVVFSKANLDIESNKNFLALCFNGKFFIGLNGNLELYKSNDGLKWIKTKTKMVSPCSKIIWNGKMFIAVRNTPDSIIDYSPDGITWKSIVLKQCKKPLADVAAGKKSILVSKDGIVLTSSNGTTWQKVFDTKEEGLYGVCCFKDAYYINNKDTNSSWYSKDGIKWYESNIIVSEFINAGNALWAFQYSYSYSASPQDYCVSIMKTTDGRKWNDVSIFNGIIIDGLIYTGDSFVMLEHSAVKEKSYNFLVSVDGENWLDSEVITLDVNITGISFGNNTLVVSTNNGIFYIKR